MGGGSRRIGVSLMTNPCAGRSVAVQDKFEPAGMPQHMGMRLDLELGRRRGPLDHSGKTDPRQ